MSIVVLFNPGHHIVLWFCDMKCEVNTYLAIHTKMSPSVKDLLKCFSDLRWVSGSRPLIGQVSVVVSDTSKWRLEEALQRGKNMWNTIRNFKQKKEEDVWWKKQTYGESKIWNKCQNNSMSEKKKRWNEWNVQRICERIRESKEWIGDFKNGNRKWKYRILEW